MTETALSRLARSLEVGLGARGVCTACLGMVALEIDHGADERSIAAAIRMVVPNLWAEGLRGPVEDALHGAVRRGLPAADEALRDFQDRGPRSDIFKAVVRRLAKELSEEVHRAHLASLN
jgi:hypothetical protein